MFRDREFDPTAQLPWNAAEVSADLELPTLLEGMARGDGFALAVAKSALLTSLGNDIEAIRFRQDVLTDCQANPAAIRELYAITTEAVEREKNADRSSLSRYPDWVLRWGIGAIESFLDTFEKLRFITESHQHLFRSDGLIRFSSMIGQELGADYCASVRNHLQKLRFPDGVLLGAELGEGNKASGHVLLQPPSARVELWLTRFPWLIRLIERITGLVFDPYSFTLDPLDHGNLKTLESLRNRGLARVAAAIGESADHMRRFLGNLRSELAFYIGCMNLADQLAANGGQVTMPMPRTPETVKLAFKELYDPVLALKLGRCVVGNDVAADGKGLAFITGANQGGKSTLLRSIGLAQLMMQSGMFVPAESFSSSVVDGFSTHYRREEDAGMESGKLDEELGRMSEIVDHITPHTLILFNESFSATNEGEGSEIARQILSGLAARKVRMIYVTHLYELTQGFVERGGDEVMFLRAERREDGTRTFKIVEGKPHRSSYAEDLYNEIFGTDDPDPGD